MYDVVSNQAFHNCCLLGAKLVCNFNHFADVFCIVYMVAKIKVRKANGLTEFPDNNVACEGSVGTGKFAQEKLEKLIVVGASTYSKYGSLLC